MRISILDDYQNVIETLECFQLLKNHEVEVIHEYIADPNELLSKINNPQVLVLNRTRTAITEYLLSQLPDLLAISQTGKNAGHIDVEACKKHNVAILEGKGDPVATAELTWNLIMNGMRQIPTAIASMKEGRWQTNLGRVIYGKTIGIWGYGRIGRRIAQYAKIFDAKVMVWGSESSRHAAQEDGLEVAESKAAFFSNVDVLTLHLRLKDATREIVRLEDLQRMKTDALLVNTARAGLIEKGALVKSLQSGRPGYAALDVYDEEPIYDPQHPLLQMSNVICTPHLGYVERRSYEIYFGIAFQNIVDHFDE